MSLDSYVVPIHTVVNFAKIRARYTRKNFIIEII